MRTTLPAVVICIAVPLAAAAREPGHPNPMAFVEHTSTAYLSRVWMSGGNVVAAEFVRLKPASLKTCRNRPFKHCKLRWIERGRTKAVGADETIDQKRAKLVLYRLDFAVTTRARPRLYWNANTLQRKIKKRFGAQRKTHLETQLTRAVKRLNILKATGSLVRPAKNISYGRRLVNGLVISVPIGKYAFSVKTLGAYYYESYRNAYARWYLIDAAPLKP